MVISLHAKFEVSSSNRSRDMEGSQNFKSRSRDPFPTPLDLILIFFSLEPIVFNIQAKFEVSSFSRSQDMRGVFVCLQAEWCVASFSIQPH